MKRTIPLLIVLISGLVMIGSHFIPPAIELKENITVWFDILAATAFVLGGGNLLKMNLQKISNQKPGWGYAVVILVAFVITFVVGLFKIGAPPAEKTEQHGWSMAQVSLQNFPLFFETTGVLPREELPPNVMGQLTGFESKPNVSKLRFRGWMNPHQQTALKKKEKEKKWHHSVDALFQKAQPPESLKERVTYNAQLQAILFLGVMSGKDKIKLLAMGKNNQWKDAVDSLYEMSNKVHSVALDKLPTGVLIPEKLKGTIAFNVSQKMLSLQGPMSDKQRDSLIEILPKGAMLTEIEKKNITQKLMALGPLSDFQKTRIKNFHQKSQSIGKRNKQLLFWLLTPTENETTPQLNQAQKNELMSVFNNQEASWVSVVDKLYVASHQTKYAWSGSYNAKGSGIGFVFDYGLVPLTATMFALLAFYVASAAFRAFRAKNIEATLLLATAFIVLLGNVYAGAVISDWLLLPEGYTIPDAKEFIMQVFNTAGSRAIMIGIALGIISTSLKVLLGIDRSYLGSD